MQNQFPIPYQLQTWNRTSSKVDADLFQNLDCSTVLLHIHYGRACQSGQGFTHTHHMEFQEVDHQFFGSGMKTMHNVNAVLYKY